VHELSFQFLSPVLWLWIIL